MASIYQHYPERFITRYYSKLYVPKHLRLTGKQLETNWNIFIKTYVSSGIIGHFRENTIQGAISAELEAAKRSRKRDAEIEAEAREEGQKKGELAFERALKTAYELHCLGRSKVEILAALGSEVRTEKGRITWSTTSNQHVKKNTGRAW